MFVLFIRRIVSDAQLQLGRKPLPDLERVPPEQRADLLLKTKAATPLLDVARSCCEPNAEDGG
jgi:hypothetical protein